MLLVQAATVQFDMPIVHVDAQGNKMDAHDGNIIQYTPGGPYYMYAMSYGSCKENPKGGCVRCAAALSCGMSVLCVTDSVPRALLNGMQVVRR